MPTDTPNQPPTDTTPVPQPSKKDGANHPPLPRLVLVIVAAFIVLLLVYAFTRPKHHTTTSKSTTTQLQTAKVDITTTGFNPATIQVKPNTQITWTNQDTAVHQVAADPYPKDDSIPGFNNSIVLQQGDTESFTFTTTGTYTYHDERNPLDLKGVVVVK